MNHEQDLQDGVESGAPSGRYIHIAPKSHPLRGKFIERVGEDDPSGIKRTYTTKALDGKPSEEKTIFEKPHSAITGSITGLYIRSRKVDFGKGLEDKHSVALALSVNGERMVLEVEQDSRHWGPFFMALPNIDIGKKVRVEAYDYDRKSDGKRMAGISFKQAAIGTIPAGAEVDPQTNMYQVPWYWTKENPGKLPPAVEFKHPKTGDVEWYFDERDAYLRDVIVPAVAERIAKIHDAGMAAQEVKANEPVTALDAAAQMAVAKKAEPKQDPDPFQIEDNDDGLPPLSF